MAAATIAAELATQAHIDVSLPLIKNSWVTGEIAPSVFGRTDLARYHTAASTMRNFWPSYRGPAYSRAGTAFVGFSMQTGRGYPPRLIPFQFSVSQGLALEFGNFYMRVVFDGAFVTEPAASITNVTQANPGVITISAHSVASATANNGAVSSSYLPGDTITLANGVFTAPGILGVTTTTLASIHVSGAGDTTYVPFDQYYKPGDSITLTCAGTFFSPAVVVVKTTKVIGLTIFTGGSGGSNGTRTVTGTTGTGTPFQASVTVSGGAITAILSITVPGDYTVNPNWVAGEAYIEPVTGAGLSGAQLLLVMGVRSVSIANGGSFTANAAGGAFTQSSTSGQGSGATFGTALFGPGSLSIVNAGQYSSFPLSPDAQSATSGSGAGATYNLTQTHNTYATGDWLYVSGVGGMTQLNGNTYAVTRLSATTYSLQDVYGNDIDTTAFGAFTSGGTVARIYTLTTPYSEQDLPYLKFVQSADTMSLCCVNQQSATEYPPLDLVRLADDSWALDQVAAGPSISPPSGASATASSTGSVDYQYVVTAIASDGTESIASPIAEVDFAVDIATTAGTITITYSGVDGSNGYNIYKASPGYGSAPPVGAVFGFTGQAFGGQFIDFEHRAGFCANSADAPESVRRRADPRRRDDEPRRWLHPGLGRLHDHDLDGFRRRARADRRRRGDRRRSGARPRAELSARRHDQLQRPNTRLRRGGQLHRHDDRQSDRGHHLVERRLRLYFADRRADRRRRVFDGSGSSGERIGRRHHRHHDDDFWSRRHGRLV